ncbi:MAG: hypothetical protein A3I11_04745 [Elusimicrobia bacterium RIFCSPLOWO2_02_FULL_39_32]|nr:MAG: hypothetical protein A2034_07355 [Elusimicrobia bacterium GWA2_38_7]OGR80137.1 MAG: hypothetical protein A3B80_00860 [Elusimicrobia bacterium RIFCSPHIGHO2_02_FULL_39_36]OGR91068.1 MAG: hypothetical protein A3I11_04745 [Elusimicrobia bacterium RIFCSPLOWO2_02_FULL_39_32]OGS00035.1 MAG: hypothetical protein A3G85_07710 [Elusimicrobia bacterium RIFCSPLOWO2_12_FULL_39_28]
MKKIGFIFLMLFFSSAFLLYVSKSSQATKQIVLEKEILEAPEIVEPVQKIKNVKGIHLTSWVAGSKKARKRIGALLKETELNSIVIAIKEFQGEVYIPGVYLAEKNKLFVNAIPDIKEYLEQLKKDGVYTIARIVVFKDDGMARKMAELAVKKPDGTLWTDRQNRAWLDPYNKQVWDYNLTIASRAVELGFEEIQFDYIRYPSDGNIRLCRYSYAKHDSTSAAKNLNAFLQEAARRLKPMGAELSIDIFGLTPSVEHDMGIGQKILQMTEWVDVISPMIYPSHYAKGEYGIANPNSQPYRVVHRTISDAKKRLEKSSARLRPYLQDFSLGVRYGEEEVKAQIKACEDLGIHEWLLWSPNCRYTRGALKSKSSAN